MLLHRRPHVAPRLPRRGGCDCRGDRSDRTRPVRRWRRHADRPRGAHPAGRGSGRRPGHPHLRPRRAQWTGDGPRLGVRRRRRPRDRRGRPSPAISTGHRGRPAPRPVHDRRDGPCVAPGFIDILSYEPNEYGIWFKDRRRRDHQPRAARPPVASSRLLRGVGLREQATPTQLRRRVQRRVDARQHRPRCRRCRRRPRRSTRSSGCARKTSRTATSRVDFEPEYTPASRSTRSRRSPRWRRIATCPPRSTAATPTTSRPGRTPKRWPRSCPGRHETGARVHVEHIISTGGTYTMAESLATSKPPARTGVEVTACTSALRLLGDVPRVGTLQLRVAGALPHLLRQPHDRRDRRSG